MGETLEIEEARELAESMMRLMRVICQPLTRDQINASRERQRDLRRRGILGP
ncbi:MAG: hypothetical protein WDN31_02510 [Hyphomicrobium sp.]